MGGGHLPKSKDTLLMDHLWKDLKDFSRENPFNGTPRKTGSDPERTQFYGLSCQHTPKRTY